MLSKVLFPFLFFAAFAIFDAGALTHAFERHYVQKRKISRSGNMRMPYRRRHRRALKHISESTNDMEMTSKSIISSSFMARNVVNRRLAKNGTKAPKVSKSTKLPKDTKSTKAPIKSKSTKIPKDAKSSKAPTTSKSTKMPKKTKSTNMPKSMFPGHATMLTKSDELMEQKYTSSTTNNNRKLATFVASTTGFIWIMLCFPW